MAKPFDVSKFRKDITKSIDGLSVGFHDPTDWISTGNHALNYLISGDFYKGVPMGKVTVFAGESGAGKSYFASANIVKNAQEQDIFVVLIDSENALDEAWLHALGVDTDESKLLKLSMSMIDDVAKTIVDMIMDGKTLFSVKAGNAVLSRLQQATKLHKKQVEKAGFLVLKTSDIPSILVETGFISNPREARRLSQKDHQNRLSKAIAAGIWDFFYENPPPGTLVASLSNEVTYRVQRGDTLSGIGQEFGVSSRAIKERNALRTSKIKIGQTLIIPRRISSQRGA